MPPNTAIRLKSISSRRRGVSLWTLEEYHAAHAIQDHAHNDVRLQRGCPGVAEPGADDAANRTWPIVPVASPPRAAGSVLDELARRLFRQPHLLFRYQSRSPQAARQRRQPGSCSAAPPAPRGGDAALGG